MSSPKDPTARSVRPRMGRLPRATDYSGIGRSSLYEAAADPRYEGLFRKNGSAIIVDFDILDRVIDDLPLANVTAPSARGRP